MSTDAGDLKDNVKETLDAIDFGNLDEMTADLGLTDMGIFAGESFTHKIGHILDGSYAADFPNIFSALVHIFGGTVLNVLPMIVLIIGITILGGFVQSLRAETAGTGVRDIIHFVTYAAVVIIVLYAVTDAIVMAGKTLSSIKTQMDIILPILLTLMVTVGASTSSSVYQPAVALLSNGVMQIFTYIIMPIFIITMIFSVVGNLSATTKYDKFVGFFSSLYKWILGITFTVFLGFLSIQGITAGTHDSISIRATKFTMSSYVPILGGYLSQGFDLVMASSVLIKNAVGLAGLYLMFSVVLAPVLKIVVFTLGLKLAAAVTQPLADGRVSNFLTSITKSFNMLLAVIIGAAFMYFVTIGLIIVTGNVL
jgi:stage III sporulation protein AE